MARLLGGASSEAEPAAAERLSAIAAHWRIELIGSAGWYLEVVDSERGLWSVEDRPGAAVALVPTDPTAVLDQLAALPGHAGLG